jgi:hypothetical protein
LMNHSLIMNNKAFKKAGKVVFKDEYECRLVFTLFLTNRAKRFYYYNFKNILRGWIGSDFEY